MKKSNVTAPDQTRLLAFSALRRQRVVILTRVGKSVITQTGVRFGSMNPPVKKEAATEESAAAEVAQAVEDLSREGFAELGGKAYETFVQRLRFSCFDDDLRRYPSVREQKDVGSGEYTPKTQDCDCAANGSETENADMIPLAQRTAEVILSNTALTGCKTLELILPPLDLDQTVKRLAVSKAALNIETLVLKIAGQSDRNAPEVQESDDSYGDTGKGNWVSVPCDCFARAFPKLKRLTLIGGVWRLVGEQCQSLEEIEAGQVLTPSIRLNNLKRLQYKCFGFYTPIIDGQSKPISPAALLADCCPKLESLSMDITDDLDILEDVLSAPLCNRLASLQIGVISDMESLFLLLTRFADRLSHIKELTLILKLDSVEKAQINRLKAFPLPIKLAFA